MNRVYLLIGLLLFAFTPVQADEYSPAYLELTQTGDEVYDVLWKVPAQSDQRLKLYVVLPEEVNTIIPVRSSFTNNAFIERSTIRRSGGLAGAEITIDGLLLLPTDVLVRIGRLDGSSEVLRLSAAKPSFVVGSAPTTIDVALTYLVFGIEHIWQGIDHLLFVACLILIAGTGRRILVTITGFTVAHSVTLTLAALDLVRMPVPPIEAIIALSIVFLAREIAHERRDTLTWRYPIAISSSFGLLHGFGFASALKDIGLPQTEIPAALLAFNVGVEIGQVTFVMLVIAVVWLITLLLRAFNKARSQTHNQVMKPMDWLLSLEKPLAYGVGSITMIWTLERVAQFWA